MENEELVSLIQQGKNVTENLGILYQQNEGFIRSIVQRFSKFAEVDDLMQEAYFALKDTVDKHDLTRENSSFLGHLKLYLQNRCLRYTQKNYGAFSFGMYMTENIRLYFQLVSRTGKNLDKETVMSELKLSEGQYDSLMQALYINDTVDLNMKIVDDTGDEASLGDIVGDGSDFVSDLMNQYIDDYASTELWEQVNQLDIRKRNIIYLIYKLNLKEEEIAKNLGIDAKTVAFHKSKALKQLKKMQKIQELAEMYDFDCGLAYRGGLQAFKNHGNVSVVERIVMKRDELEGQFRQAQQQILTGGGSDGT